MEKKEYQNNEDKTKIKKVSELLKDNNLMNQKIIPHSAILSNIKDTFDLYNNDKNKDKMSNNINRNI